MFLMTAFFSFRIWADEFKDISLSFKEVETHKVLKIISDFSGKGLVLPDSSMGVTTVYLKNVPWNKALRAIAKSENLEVEITDYLIIVSKGKCKTSIFTTKKKT